MGDSQRSAVFLSGEMKGIKPWENNGNPSHETKKKVANMKIRGLPSMAATRGHVNSKADVMRACKLLLLQ